MQIQGKRNKSDQFYKSLIRVSESDSELEFDAELQWKSGLEPDTE